MVRPITSERIREERRRLGLTQEQLGKKLGKEKAFISRMETSGKHLTVDLLDELADIFNCSTDYLLGRTDKRK